MVNGFTFALTIEPKYREINKTTMDALKLKAEYVKLIEDNPKLLGAIAQRTNKSINTIERWCKLNDSRLIMLSVIEEVREFAGLPKSTSLTETVSVEKAA